MSERVKQKVSMVSLGCPKNLVDAEVMLGVLSKQEYEITTDEKDADVIIVNTCSFIKEAKQESIDAILDLAERKHDGRCHTLIVSGCLPQRYQQWKQGPQNGEPYPWKNSPTESQKRRKKPR